MLVNNRFPVLSIVAKVLWGIGIVIVIVGILALGAEGIEFLKMSKPGAEWVWAPNDIAKIVAGVIFIPMGFIVMATAEIIGVLFAIELNTRK
jgi:hypothetical protein